MPQTPQLALPTPDIWEVFGIALIMWSLWEMWAGVCTVKAKEAEATHTLFTFKMQELHCSIPVVACMPKAFQPTPEEGKITIINALC